MHPSVKTVKPTYDELEQRVRDLERIVPSGALSGPSIAAGALDIDNLREAEAKLRESEEKFRLAFYTSPDAINLNRASDGMFIDINEGFTALTGYSRAEVIGKTSLELNLWDDPTDRERLVSGLMTTGYVENLEARFRRKNGRIGIGWMSARLLRIENEDVILSVTRDLPNANEQRSSIEPFSRTPWRAFFRAPRKAGSSVSTKRLPRCADMPLPPKWSRISRISAASITFADKTARFLGG